MRCVVAGSILAFSAGWSGADPAAPGRPIARLHPQEEYRGHQRVHAMLQTSDGLVYATNYAGLREWDGQTWRRIAVPTSWVLDLAASPDGRVWAAAFDDLGYAGASGGSLNKSWVSLRDRLPPGSAPVGQIGSVVWHQDSAWWGGSDRVWQWDGKEMREWKFPSLEGSSCALRDAGGELYLQRRSDALYRWSGREWQVVSRLPAFVAGTLAVVVKGWRDGQTLAVDGAGQGWRILAESVEPWALPAAETLAGSQVNRGLHLANGQILLCTQDRGIVLLGADGMLVGAYGEAAGLPSPVTLGACADSEGGIWVGTQTGLVRMNLFSAVTEIPPPSRAAGIFFRLVRHLERLYARGDDGVYRLDESEPTLAHWQKLPGLSTLAFDLLDHPRGLLVGTEAGLAGMNAAGEIVPLVATKTPPHTLAASPTDPDLIFAGHTDGVSVLRFSAGAWELEGRLPGLEVDARAILEDARGTLWIGAPAKGIFRVRRPPGESKWLGTTMKFYRAGEDIPKGYISFAETSDGPVFSCWPEILSYDAAGDRFVPAPEFAATTWKAKYAGQFSGPPDRLWFQSGDPTGGASGDPAPDTRSAIGSLRRQADGSWQWQPLPQHIMGQVDYYGAYSTFWEAGGGGREGVLWVPTARRVLRIDVTSASREESSTLAPVMVRTAEREGEDLAAHPHLPYTRGPFRFTFASPRHAPGTAMTYRYRLRGSDESWSEWSPSTSASYTNLAGGSFRFEVEGRDEEGRPARPAGLDFSMAPPWFRTPWAWLGYAAGAFALGTALLRWRMAAARHEQRRLEGLVEARTADWRQAKERAEAASRAKTLFLASMSHELRTPLHAILGYAQLLGNDREASPRIRDRLRVVESSGQHLLRLIGNVLDLSKLEVGAVELRAEPISLRTWLADAVSGPEARAAAKNLAFAVGVDADMPDSILVDAQKLRQVLDNLLSNAVKFTERGGVTVRIARAGRQLRLEVADTGAGISPAAQARLFRIFGEAEARATRDETGAGLGLVIAQRLVAMLGGELQVASELGRGTRFWTLLPLLEAAPAAEISPADRRTRVTGYLGARRRVLAVDDVEANRELFRDLLAPLGFEVALAASAEEALVALSETRPDLLILDLRLPDMDGLQLARKLRSSPDFEGVKILAASASVLGHDPREPLEAGCDGFLPKPFLAEDFLQQIAGLLALTWIAEDAGQTADAPASAAPLEEADYLVLAAAAQEGDVVTLRRKLAQLRLARPRSTDLDPFERLIRAYDLDGILVLLETRRSLAPLR